MKRAVDDSRSGTISNSPFNNGKSKKLKLFHGTDSPDLSEEAEFSEYGSKAKLIKEIVLIRKGRMNVAPKLESISASESSGNQSTFANVKMTTIPMARKLESASASKSSGNHTTFANNALATTPAHVEDDEDIQPQSGNPTPVLEGLVDPSVEYEVEIIDGISPLQGNAFPDHVPEKRISRRSRSKMNRKKALHLIMKDAKPLVLDDHNGIDESPNDVATFEIFDLEDEGDEKGREIAEEYSVSNEVPDESQINLLFGKSPTPQIVDDCKRIEESPDDVGAFEIVDQQDDANEKGPEIAEECSVSNKIPGETQINLLLGKSLSLHDNTPSDGEAMLETDELDDMWMEFGLAIETAKGNSGFDNSVRDNPNHKPNEDCEHSLILRDDIGHVCRICGKVEMDIQKIFEFQYKTPRSSRTYKCEPRSKGNMDHLEIPAYGIELTENKVLTNFSAHPRHAKQMRHHQVEGFRFLARNLVSDKPSGCILAHAPGSGKTFMIISFIQSFMGKYPNARPLIILPKGILAVWKTEFLKWQIEDIPLYDLYSSKPDRSQQLEVLSKWVMERSILFMGYMQFSSIMSGVEKENNELTTSCQKILSEAPSVLILDEGHTPRNSETEIVNSISKVKTPRKVVLSGTLYQNHVCEVFNILNLVYPKFLQSETSKVIVKRIMSRVAIGVRRINKWSDGSFHDLVEQTLQSDDLNIKLHVIKDLREMTNEILHYYKGDFLDDLPGLEDYTVVLNLTSKQQAQTKKLKRISSLFKRSSVGSAVYLHPDLKRFTDTVQASNEKQTAFDDATIDRLIKQVDVNDGVKAKFFLNVLKLCQVTGEKLLVFSQYLLPLKFLERLTVEVMKWSPGLEIFMITGDSNSEMREQSMNQFNNTPSAKVFFGSIKACGEGISLVGASRIIILDVHPNPSVTRQAVGRAFRPGQKKKVFVYRLIAAESMEEEDHTTYFSKELISKLWFEWNEHCSMKDFELKQIDVDDCGDNILESTRIHSDVKALYKR